MIKALKQIKSVKHIIPALLAGLTGKTRYLPKLDFNWKGNVVHSLLMCYYIIFWRRHGIRPGGLTWYEDATGKRKVWATTWFGVLQLIEHEIIRSAFKWKLKWKEIYIPVLAPAGNVPLNYHGLKVPILMLVGFAEGEGAATGTSTAPQLTNVEGSGADRWLGIHLNFEDTSVSAVPAFGGSNSTIISVNVNTADGTRNISSYRLINPSTTSGNMDATLAASFFWTFMATTYTGVDQTTSTADEDNNSANTAPGSPVTYTNTSNLNDSVQFLSAKEDSAATSFTVDAPAVLRQGEDASPINMLADNLTATASGSDRSITINWTGGSQKLGAQFCMVRPSLGGAFLSTIIIM